MADRKMQKALGLVTDDNTGGPFLVECQGCGDVYPSHQCRGGAQIADTGDHEDSICPRCGQVDPEECANAALAWNVQQRKINALLERVGKVGTELQSRVQAWVETTFPPELHTNMTERGDRLLEEVIELLQSNGYDQDRIATLANYVYARPAGEPEQEAGGVMLTLAAYCSTVNINMHEAGEVELVRVNQPHVITAIQAKQRAKAGIQFGSRECPSGYGSLRRQVSTDDGEVGRGCGE